MKLSPYSFNGTQINDGTNYRAYIERGSAPGAPGANAQYIKRPGAWPVYTGKDFQSVTYTIKIDCMGNFSEQWETLNRLFFMGDEETHLFVIQDEDDSNRQYQVYATPTGQPLFGNDGPVYTIKLAFDDPIWEGVTLQSSTWAITGATDSTSITPAGNMDTYPVFEITPTQAPSTDYRYMEFIRVLPQSSNPWPNRPLELSGTSATDHTAAFDTANLVSTGQMQADGDDLRVFMDGMEVDRWLVGMNSTDTQIWIVADMPPKREFTLVSAITTASTSIEVTQTKTARKYIQDCPASGWLVLDSSLGSTDSEDVYYSEKIVTDTTLGFVIASRGARDTAALTHAAGANVRFMPHDIRMVWGNATVSAPDNDDSYKPLTIRDEVKKATHNDKFYYENLFVDAEQLAPDKWGYSVSRDNPMWGRSDVFTTTDTLASTDPSITYAPQFPATVMGMKIGSYWMNQIYRADTAQVQWQVTFPDEISSVGMDTAVRFNSSTSQTGGLLEILVSGTPGMRSFGPYSLWSDIMDTSDPGTWETPKSAFGSPTVPADMINLFIRFSGSPAASAGSWLGAGVTEIHVGFAHPPSVKRWTATAGETVQLDIDIDNATTGEGFHIKLPMLEDETVTIDCNPSAPSVTYNGQVVNGCIELDSVRDAWMTLLGAANTINYQCNLANAIELTIVTKWYNRMAYL